MSEQISGVETQPSVSIEENKNVPSETVNTKDQTNVSNDSAALSGDDKTSPVVNEQVVKKEFTQHEIDNIVKRAKEQAKRQGYEAAKNEMLAKINPQQSQQQPQHQEQQNPEFYKGYQAARNEQQQQLDTMAAQDFAGRLKVDPESKEANEVLSFFGEFDKTAMPLVYQLNSLGNTSEVFNYLKNNSKAKQEIKNLIQLDYVAVSNGMRSTMAHNKLLEISERIKQNADAPNVKANNPKPPKGNDIKPSTIALGEKTKLKVSDIIKNMNH